MGVRIFKLEAADYSGALRFVSGLHVALQEGKTTSWVTITRTGKFRDPRYGEFEITREMLLSMVGNFDKKVYGQDVFIDVAHKPQDGAAGKVLRLTVEGDRLRALVEWTPLGVAAIKERGYQYLSAEYHENWQDNETMTQYGPVLLGAGLVIRPCIKRLDPIQLAAADPLPTLLHPLLQSELTTEITTMWKLLIEALLASLTGMKLSEGVVHSLVAAYTKAVAGITDEPQAKALMASFEDSGRQLAAQFGSQTVTLDIKVPDLIRVLSEADIKKIIADHNKTLADEAAALAAKRDANLKLLGDTIAAAQSLDADTRRQLLEAVSDLISPDMTEAQVKALAENQIKLGGQIAAARKLAGMGFSFPGSPRISVDDSNSIKRLQEHADVMLGISALTDVRRYAATGGQLQPENKALAEKALDIYDRMYGAALHDEAKRLAAGDSKVSDVAVPAAFERTVIREALYSLVGLQFVDAGTAIFGGSYDVPYTYRDSTAASRSSTRVYEGGAVPRAAVKQAVETTYPIPQKLAFEVSDELRYLCSNGQLINWDIVAENARNAIRIIGEDTEKILFDEVLNASDQFAVTAVTNEAVGTGNGSKSIWPLANFPVVRPKIVKNLQGAQVGSTSYPVALTINSVAISEWDGSGSQSAGTYYWLDYNIGEIHVVDKDGAAVNVPNTQAIVCSYSATTNVYKFDTDLGSLSVGEKYDDFLYRFGLRKAILEDQRHYGCDFGLMSSTVRTQIEQARQFAANYARAGTNLATDGNLGVIKGVPQFKTTAPGLAMADARVVLGARGQTRYRMAKPWTLGELQDQKDSNGRFIGKKEAYGDQFVFLHTPTQLKGGYTSVVLYSASARVSR